MTQLEILQLAQYGARKRVSATAYDYYRYGGSDDGALKRLKNSMREYDEVTEMLEKETHSSAATPECVSVPVMIGGQLIETITVQGGEHYARQQANSE